MNNESVLWTLKIWCKDNFAARFQLVVNRKVKRNFHDDVEPNHIIDKTQRHNLLLKCKLVFLIL